MFVFQRDHGLKANGIVDPHTWYRLFPDQPLRTYPHPGYLPPIRLHDLRHLAATLALAAGTDMKVISAMLRHSSHKITADTYTSVLPEVAREAAEAVVSLVPRRNARGARGGATTPRPLCPETTPKRSSGKKKSQVVTGAPPGT